MSAEHSGAVPPNTPIVDDVFFRTVTDGDDTVGIPTGFSEFITIDHPVEETVITRITHENQVVDGYDASCVLRLTNIQGKLVTETVKQIDAFLSDGLRHSPNTP